MITFTERNRIRIGSIFDVPITLHLSWIVVFGLITWTLATGYFPPREPGLPVVSYWVKALIASLLFFLSILLHEAAHAVVARRSGIPIQSITLFIFGGVARMGKDPEKGTTEAKVAVAGPVVSLALSLAFHLTSSLPALAPSIREVARYLALINVVLALFNLVPAFPLDGGRILRGLLWGPLGKTRATRIAARSGTLFAFLLIFNGVFALLAGAPIAGMWHLMIGWFLREAAGEAYQQAHLDEVLRGMTTRDVMVEDVLTIPAAISVQEAIKTYILRSGYGGYPVLRDDAVVGLLCLRDVLRLPPEELEHTSVQSVMLPLSDAIAVSPDVPLRDALAKMAQGGKGRLLVVEGGRLAGLFTTDSVLRHVRVRERLGERAGVG